MRNILTLMLVLIISTTFAQEVAETTNTRKGELSWGVRSTGNLFSGSGNYFGTGAGFQIRHRVTKGLGSEWFADWITTDLGGLGKRTDAHIGVSAMIYPGKNPGTKNSFTPYILGGFCGDYTQIISNLSYDELINGYTQNTKDRWSFATQLGLGTHYNITEKFDISLSGQYVLHFGANLTSEVLTNNLGAEYLNILSGSGESLEGHVFITLSANFVLIDFLKKK